VVGVAEVVGAREVGGTEVVGAIDLVGAADVPGPASAVGARGMALTAAVNGPLPTLLRAATRNQERVPFVNPDTVYAVTVDTPSFNVTQPVVPFGER
jgi:hypothetical protein